MEKGCSRLSSDLEIGTSHSLASRLPYNPERMINGPAATVARRRRASGAGHRCLVVGKTARCSDRGCEPGSRDEWAT
jgi:hypothetical protein